MSQRPKKSKVTWILIALTTGYAVGFYFLAVQTKACDPSDVLISPNWFHGFWDRFLACRQINELGDTLGGAFAPIAFLWLAGTVFIQSQELAAQRQELDETQSVMREQLEVARQQVEETKASTALFKKQTEILERDQQSRDEAQADAEFDEMVKNFLVNLFVVGGFLFTASKWEQRYQAANKTTNWRKFEGVPYIIIPSDQHEKLDDISNTICLNIENAIDALKAPQVKIEPESWSSEVFDLIYFNLNEIIKKRDDISKKHAILSRRYRLDLMKANLASLDDAVKANKAAPEWAPDS